MAKIGHQLLYHLPTTRWPQWLLYSPLSITSSFSSDVPREEFQFSCSCIQVQWYYASSASDSLSCCGVVRTYIPASPQTTSTTSLTYLLVLDLALHVLDLTHHVPLLLQCPVCLVRSIGYVHTCDEGRRKGEKRRDMGNSRHAAAAPMMVVMNPDSNFS